MVQTDVTGNATAGYSDGGICVPLPGNCSEGYATSATATTQAGTTC